MRSFTNRRTSLLQPGDTAPDLLLPAAGRTQLLVVRSSRHAGRARVSRLPGGIPRAPTTSRASASWRRPTLERCSSRMTALSRIATASLATRPSSSSTPAARSSGATCRERTRWRRQALLLPSAPRAIWPAMLDPRRATSGRAASSWPPRSAWLSRCHSSRRSAAPRPPQPKWRTAAQPASRAR